MVRRRALWFLSIAGLAAASIAGCKSGASFGAPPDGGRADGGRRSGSETQAPAAAPRADGGPEADRTGAAPEAARDPGAYQALLCRSRRCCVTETWPAGHNRRGRALTVVAVRDQRCGNDAPGEAEASASETDPHACTDYWLVTDAGAGEKRPARNWLHQDCEGDKWEFAAEVDPETQTFSAGGHSLFSDTRTDNGLLIGLEPLRVISEREGSLELFHSRDESWNWEQFAGKVELGVDYCPDKAPPDAGIEADRDAPTLETAALLLPRVTVPAAFAAGGWKTLALDRCAAQVDGAGSSFAVFGGPGSAADASMKVVLSADGDLYAQIEDDRLVTSAKSWVKQDHLELWIAARPPDCVDPAAPSPAVQWGVGLADGKVFAAFGDPPTAPAVAAHRAGGVVRLKLTLGALLGDDARISVAYSDSDDGVHQKRLIATSSLAYGRWWTLGTTRQIDAAQATCVIERGALQPKLKPFWRKK